MMGDTNDWKATMQLDGGEEELTLTLPSWMDEDDVKPEFIAEAQNVYDLRKFPVVLEVRAR